MSAPTVPPSDPDTRRRLLEAAGQVFAEVGFQAATVRDICKRAEANGAAVNYHFGDKRSLYREVLRFSFAASIERYPARPPADVEHTAEQRLEWFVRAFFLRVFSSGVPSWHSRLMVREMAEPTDALDWIVADSIRPMFELLLEIVGALLGPGVEQRTVALCARSVVGQCVFYKHAEPVLARIGHAPPRSAQEIEVLAQHVTRFSLAAIRSMSADGGRSSSA